MRTIRLIVICLSIASLSSAQTQAWAQTSSGLVKDGDGPVANVLPGCGQVPLQHESSAPEAPPTKFSTSPGGVEMRSGAFQYSNTDLSIGGERDTGLALVRRFNFSQVLRQGFGPFFDHNWNIQVKERRLPRSGACYPDEYDRELTVFFDGGGESFWSEHSPVDYEQLSMRGLVELKALGAGEGSPTLTYIAQDGTTVVFRPLAADCGPGGYGRKCAFASSVTRPDGTIYTLGYDQNGTSTANATRLRSVVSNRGYALLFEYAAGSNLVTKICALNLAFTTKPADNTCASGLPSASYTYTGSTLAQATDSEQKSWGFAKPTSSSFSMTRPGENAPYVTSGYTLEDQGVLGSTLVVTSQTFATGLSYSYVWDRYFSMDGSRSSIAGGKWVDANGKSVWVKYGQYEVAKADFQITKMMTPGPESVTDELGRVSTARYCPVGYTAECIWPLQGTTMPEGNGERYSYDNYLNVVQTTKFAKPGSGLSDVVESKSFTYAGSAYLAVRAKPTSVTDGRNGTISYTYDLSHGGVLSETGPADNNNVRPVKRYAYQQYHAWLSDGGAGFSQGATPVWLLSQERTCRSGATTTGATGSALGCINGASDEVVISYDYGVGDASHGNNLLLRGKVITADGVSLRSCYGYDANGRKIWETSPRAGLAACY